MKRATRLPRRKRILFTAAGLLLVLAVLAVLLEVGTRLLVPAATFRVLANVFVADSDPAIAYTLRRSYTGSAFGVDLATNSLGFRGGEWAPVKPPGTFRIALLGDSMAFGFGVPFAQTMGELLAARLARRLGRPVEVMNFGVNGYNTQQELAVLGRRALPLAPDLVLVMPTTNDADPPFWADGEGFLRWGTQAQPDGANIAWDRHQRGLARFQRMATLDSRFLLWLRLQWFRFAMARAARKRESAEGIARVEGWLPPVGNGPVDEALRRPVYEPLLAMVDLCRDRGAAIAFVTYLGMTSWRATVNAVAAARQVPLLELIPLLEGADSWADLVRKWSLGWDTHMGAEAQAVWAEGIERFLVAQGLVR